MKNIKKIRFSDICGMLEKDQMKEILGGSGGVYYGSGLDQYYGGGMMSPSIPMSNSPSNGWGGGKAIGSTFGGIPYNPGTNNDGSSFGGSSGSGSSYSSSTYGSNSYSIGWSDNDRGITTNDPFAINRFFNFLASNNGIPSSSQIGKFMDSEALYVPKDAVQLNNVTVPSYYNGPGTIPQGVIYNNGILSLDKGVIIGSTSYQTQSTTSTQSGGGPTDCVFQCMAQIGALYGASGFSFTEMKANYDSIYNTSTTPGSVAPAAMGVNEILLSNFVDQYFNRAPITTTSQLDTFITAGGDNFAIGVIRKYSTDGVSSTLHAVVLTGSEGNSYKYTDPQNAGASSSVVKSSLVSFVAITGICN